MVYAQAYVSLNESLSSARIQNHNALYFFALALVGTFGVFLQNFCLSIASEKLTGKVRITLFQSILRKPVLFLDQHSSGVLSTTLNSSPDAIQNLTGSTFGNFITTLATLIGGAIVALIYNWRFALVCLVSQKEGQLVSVI